MFLLSSGNCSMGCLPRDLHCMLCRGRQSLRKITLSSRAAWAALVSSRQIWATYSKTFKNKQTNKEAFKNDRSSGTFLVFSFKWICVFARWSLLQVLSWCKMLGYSSLTRASVATTDTLLSTQVPATHPSSPNFSFISYYRPGWAQLALTIPLPRGYPVLRFPPPNELVRYL